MVDERASDRSHIVGVGREVACEMAAHNRICEIADAVDDEYPCEEKMPLPSHREPTIAGNSQPRRKAALSKLAVGAAGRAQPAGGDEFMAENSRLANDLVGIGRGRFD